jgi:hypothetical protein
MKAETIRLHKKAEKIQEKLREFNFHFFEHYWSNDGVSSGAWEDVSVGCDEPDHEAFCYWQFGFRSSWSTNRRLHLEAIIPVHEDYFVFDLKYYQDIELHDRKGYYGPVSVSSVQGILEEDLTNLQKYIDYLIKQ